jgi:MarR family transcriptional regulator for hemolysin
MAHQQAWHVVQDIEAIMTLERFRRTFGNSSRISLKYRGPYANTGQVVPDRQLWIYRHMSTHEGEDWRTTLTWTVLPAGRAWQRAAGIALAQSGVSLSIAAVILVIARLGDGIRQKDVAEESALDPAAIARSVTQLEREGLLKRHKDPSDGRAKTLHLTKRGRAMALSLGETLDGLRNELIAGMDDAEGRIAVRVLRNLESRCLAFSSGDAQSGVPWPPEA